MTSKRKAKKKTKAATTKDAAKETPSFRELLEKTFEKPPKKGKKD